LITGVVYAETYEITLTAVINNVENASGTQVAWQYKIQRCKTSFTFNKLIYENQKQSKNRSANQIPILWHIHFPFF
jgi:hypothetical protein